ncbi:hypothetical protein SLA2020_265400 [Shorea laevis]
MDSGRFGLTIGLALWMTRHTTTFFFFERKDKVEWKWRWKESLHESCVVDGGDRATPFNVMSYIWTNLARGHKYCATSEPYRSGWVTLPWA